MNGRQGSRHDAERMVFTWSRITQANPWHVAPSRFGADSMIWVIGAILDVALAKDVSADATECLVRAAAAHGDQRRLQGSDEARVSDEYHALAGAFRNRFRVTAPPSVLVRIDQVMTVAIAMAMHGYHRSDRGPTPSWAAQLEAQIVASSLSLSALIGHASVADAQESGVLGEIARRGATGLDLVSLAILLNPVSAAAAS